MRARYAKCVQVGRSAVEKQLLDLWTQPTHPASPGPGQGKTFLLLQSKILIVCRC